MRMSMHVLCIIYVTCVCTSARKYFMSACMCPCRCVASVMHVLCVMYARYSLHVMNDMYSMCARTCCMKCHACVFSYMYVRTYLMYDMSARNDIVAYIYIYMYVYIYTLMHVSNVCMYACMYVM